MNFGLKMRSDCPSTATYLPRKSCLEDILECQEFVSVAAESPPLRQPHCGNTASLIRNRQGGRACVASSPEQVLEKYLPGDSEEAGESPLWAGKGADCTLCHPPASALCSQSSPLQASQEGGWLCLQQLDLGMSNVKSDSTSVLQQLKPEMARTCCSARSFTHTVGEGNDSLSAHSKQRHTWEQPG